MDKNIRSTNPNIDTNNPLVKLMIEAMIQRGRKAKVVDVTQEEGKRRDGQDQVLMIVKDRLTDTSEITIGYDTEYGVGYYFADIVYDSDEERCPIECDVDTIVKKPTLEEVIPIAETISVEFNIPIRYV